MNLAELIINKVEERFDKTIVDQGIDAVRQVLADSIISLLGIIGLIAVMMGGIEVSLQGKGEIFFIYLLAYTPILFCWLLRKKYPYQTLTTIVLLDCYLLAVLVLGGVGLSGAGTILLITFCVMTTAFKGIFHGLISIFLSIAAVLSVGTAMSMKWIPIDIVAMTNSTRIEAWIMASMLFLLVGLILVLCIGFLQNRLQRSIVGLKQSEEKYRTMIEHSNDMIWTLDLHGRFTFFNVQTEKVAGLKFEHWMGRPLSDLLFDDSIKDFEKMLQSNGNGDTGHYELVLMTPDYKKRIISANTGPIIVEDKVDGLVLFGRDITEQRLLEQQFQQAQKMESIGTLAGGIAHDFNNILVPILGHSELMQDDLPEDSMAYTSAKEINAAAVRAKDLVQQILTFSRQENTDFRLMKIQPILKETLKMIQSTFPATIEIVQAIDPKCGPIKADPTQIHQVIMNLTTNAYHAMEEHGGRLIVALREVNADELDLPGSSSEHYACLTVKDSGMGIPSDISGKIFDPFFTTKAQGKGTGMGLSVVHGIVKRMDGEIHLKSSPHQGTEFNVYLPLEMTERQDNELERDEQPIPHGTGHILLVDNEKSIIDMEKQMLERLGYKVTSRIDGLEAVDLFRTAPKQFDLVITDLDMPKLTGDQLSRELLTIDPDVKIILCTGFADKDIREIAHQLGIKAVMMKPILQKDFADTIQSLLL